MTEIIYIHGLRAQGTMFPFKLYNKAGHTITYKTTNVTFDQMLDEVDTKIFKIVNSKDMELILVGWSMGGLIANRLHQRGWKIKLAIYLASPLNGASILSYIPIKPWNNILKFLAQKDKEVEPPHEYYTYSLGWFNSNFDGRVFKDDVIINKERHEHIPFTSHSLSVLDPRILDKVYKKIKEHYPEIDKDKDTKWRNFTSFGQGKSIL